jgi:hypothetical protein
MAITACDVINMARGNKVTQRRRDLEKLTDI